MIKSVIFDFDGVILDTVDVKTEAFRKIFEAHGGEIVSKVIDQHINNGGVSRFEKFCCYYSEFLKREFSNVETEEIGIFFSQLVFEGILNSELIEGVRHLINRYHKKLIFFIASGTPQKELISIVDTKGLTPYFQGVYCSPETK